jgi:hypothetical protein
VYVLLFFVISTVIFVLLLQIAWFLALLFFLLAIITLPAAVIQRREAMYQIDVGLDAEHHGMGLVRLFRTIGLDTTGIALGILLLILGALIARSLAVH